ncbi:hypothetical protein SANTM175S_00591 [Streptomyces antimycoticus]
MTGSHPTRSRLTAALRPAAFGADPAGERMERIRRSPNFANGVFVNPVGARTAPSGSMLKFASTYFRKEERVRRAPAGTVPVHPTTVADLATPPASGLRLTWMGHSSVLVEIDGRRVLFDPVWGAALFALLDGGAQAAAPGAGGAAGAGAGGRGGHLPRPLRPSGHAHDPGAGAEPRHVRRPARASAPIWSAGASRPTG